MLNTSQVCRLFKKADSKGPKARGRRYTSGSGSQDSLKEIAMPKPVKKEAIQRKKSVIQRLSLSFNPLKPEKVKRVASIIEVAPENQPSLPKNLHRLLQEVVTTIQSHNQAKNHLLNHGRNLLKVNPSDEYLQGSIQLLEQLEERYQKIDEKERVLLNLLEVLSSQKNADQNQPEHQGSSRGCK